MEHDSSESFSAVKARLDEIVDIVSDDDLPLDDALSLYEEAVKLSLRASDMLEEDIAARSTAEEMRDDATLGDTDESMSAEGSAATDSSLA